MTLQSYRYAWAERARKCGFPQRFAQEALGHNSKAVHAAYAKKAEVHLPSLEDWGKQIKAKLVQVEFAGKSDIQPVSVEAENLQASQPSGSGEMPSGSTDGVQQEPTSYAKKVK